MKLFSKKDSKTVETENLPSNEVVAGLRVMINKNYSKYRGQLGTVVELSNGCCSGGICSVFLDSEVLEEFRYGYQGDISHLLKVVKEPPRPEIIFLTKATAKLGAIVKIYGGSNKYHYDAKRGEGKITEVEDSWATISFKDGYEDDYTYSENERHIILIKEASETEAKQTTKQPKQKVTPETAKEGARVKIAKDSDFRGQSKTIGTIKNIDQYRSGWAAVWFDDDDKSHVYRYGRPDIDHGVSDLILIKPAP
ncbi:MAG: hypothetical protein PHR00_02750 [Patescibacteria group bacterium]|nr:hypothetical protein [Patescibacteria group bacterium]